MSEFLLLVYALSQGIVFSFKLLVVRNDGLNFNIMIADGLICGGDLYSDSLGLLSDFDSFSLLLIIQVFQDTKFVLQ
jgi:hypothetical protein